MLLFPLAAMMLLTLFSMTYSGGHYSGTQTDLTDKEVDMTIDGDTQSGSIDIEGAGNHQFNMDTSTAVLAILLTALAIGIIAGIRILGSGISDISQDLVFNSILFLGIWACLSIVSNAIILEETVGTFLWVFMTVVYIVGIGIHMKGYS